MLKSTLMLACLCVTQTCLAQAPAAGNIVRYEAQAAGLDVNPTPEFAVHLDSVRRQLDASKQSLGDTYAGFWINYNDRQDKVFINLAVTKVSAASKALATQPLTNLILVKFSLHDMEMAAQAVGRAFKKTDTISGFATEFDIPNNRLVVRIHRMHFAALRKALSAQGIPLQLVHLQHQEQPNTVNLFPEAIDLGIGPPLTPLHEVVPQAKEIAEQPAWLCGPSTWAERGRQRLSFHQIEQAVPVTYVRYSGGRPCILQSTNKEQP